LDKFYGFAHIIRLFFSFDRFDLYCKIRAAQLTKPATDTVLWSHRRDLVLIVQFQDLFRAKLNAYATSLAPTPVYMMLS
jgi:hypothetical protein